MRYNDDKGGYKLFQQWFILWHIWFFKYMQLRRVQKCHIGTSIIRRLSVLCAWKRTFKLNCWIPQGNKIGSIPVILLAPEQRELLHAHLNPFYFVKTSKQSKRKIVYNVTFILRFIFFSINLEIDQAAVLCVTCNKFSLIQYKLRSLGWCEFVSILLLLR